MKDTEVLSRYNTEPMLDKKGFTLIELLIVLGIIGLLFSIILLSVNKERKKSEYTAIGQQLEQVELALHLYVSDHYKTIWPETHGNCQQLYRMVAGPSSYPVAGGCRNVSFGSQHKLFSGFSNYLSGRPLNIEILGFYVYENPRPPAITKKVSLKKCPDPNVSDPNKPGGGVMIRIGDDGDSPTTIPPLFDYLDNIYDKGDGTACGKIRMRTGADPEIYWILGEDKNDLLF